MILNISHETHKLLIKFNLWSGGMKVKVNHTTASQTYTKTVSGSHGDSRIVYTPDTLAAGNRERSIAGLQAYGVRRTKRHLYRLWSFTTRCKTSVRLHHTTQLTCHQRIYGGIRWDQFVRLATSTTEILTDLKTDLVVANNKRKTRGYYDEDTTCVSAD